MLGVFAAAEPVVVQVREASGGASLESILVFAVGVLAAFAAIGAALITTKSASSRLERQLGHERERFEGQLLAEAERFESQFEHERYLARRAEASSNVEQICRLISRSGLQISRVTRTLLRGEEPENAELDRVTEHLEVLLEEIGIMGLRFGEKSPLVAKLGNVVQAMRATIPSPKELPLSDENKEELRAKKKQINKAESDFFLTAKDALDSY
ncbi:MAG TPA: hypothetical protein VFS54_10250 [Solirubrobacterales bacterium]|nr:hypothetical protein [Solirubrobacterales bacterium]